MKLNDENVVDNMTGGRCILTDSMKSGDDYFNFGHNSEIGYYIESDNTIPAYLVGSYYL